MDKSERMVRMGYPFLSVVERYYLKNTVNMIFVSDFIRKDVEWILQKQVPSSKTIRNGVDLERFNRRHIDEPHPERLNILYCGRLLALKGLNNLMEAFAAVHKANPETHLTLVGGGNVGQWSQTAKDSGVPETAITFLGQRKYEEMPEILGQADIFVLPSISESMPFSLLEAMACGNACVASRVGGIPEIINHGKNGYLVNPGDSNELADSMNLLIGDAALRAKLGHEAKEHIARDFSLKGTVRLTREMFLSILGGSR
jgi:glycosyltransferase involved in cell wall biosynthesis